nr:MAG TPA: hypothetical protein [Bacteriophage sp.]
MGILFFTFVIIIIALCFIGGKTENGQFDGIVQCFFNANGQRDESTKLKAILMLADLNGHGLIKEQITTAKQSEVMETQMKAFLENKGIKLITDLGYCNNGKKPDDSFFYTAFEGNGVLVMIGETHDLNADPKEIGKVMYNDLRERCGVKK